MWEETLSRFCLPMLSLIFGLDNKLIKELDKMLKHEEILWFQKSRKDCIQDGNQNTKFYHQSTIICRNRGHIKLLKIKGEWVFDFHILSDHITNHFKFLFNRSQTNGDLNPNLFEGRQIDRIQIAQLARGSSLDEVKKAMFGMKRSGSPGPNGIQAVFYQRFWDVVGKYITEFVNMALCTRRVPEGVLEAFITLIPKKDCPESANDFRPIMLLNVAFKVFSKVLVTRLRPIMSKQIVPCQNSFLSGRSTLDNVILTQEVVHCMSRKKRKKGFMVIKLDLHKLTTT